MEVRKKKYLGQHFLNDKNIASKIASSLSLFGTSYQDVLEVGPGDGMLTRFLVQKENINLVLVEYDSDLIENLEQEFGNKARIINTDFLKTQPENIFPEQFGLTGNFPYNISSQILIKAVKNRARIPEVVGMFQRELAERIASKPGSKQYGRISVILQLFYDITLLFRVSNQVFSPPPKVESAVIRLVRKSNKPLACDEKLLFDILKCSFGQRRKKLKNTLGKAGWPVHDLDDSVLNARPEVLSPDDFVQIALTLDKKP